MEKVVPILSQLAVHWEVEQLLIHAFGVANGRQLLLDLIESLLLSLPVRLRYFLEPFQEDSSLKAMQPRFKLLKRCLIRLAFLFTVMKISHDRQILCRFRAQLLHGGCELGPLAPLRFLEPLSF